MVDIFTAEQIDKLGLNWVRRSLSSNAMAAWRQLVFDRDQTVSRAFPIHREFRMPSQCAIAGIGVSGDRMTSSRPTAQSQESRNEPSATVGLEVA